LNNSKKKPNLIELESLRSELIEKTLITSSNNLRLFLYHNFFELVFTLNNSNLEEAFLKEFLNDYLNSIKKYEVWGNDPSLTKKIFEQLNCIGDHSFAAEHITALNLEFRRIELQSIKLTKILNGDDFEDVEQHKAFFPLIDYEAQDDFYGTVESVTVRISKAADVDIFIIVPSEKEIEKRLSEQCRNSWLIALNISKQYVKKPYKYHEVIINFDKKEGFYEGNSLGIALTLSFLEEILKFYNPTYLIKLVDKSAFTGGLSESGEILNTSEYIIQRKVSAIFFSIINSFVIPKPEENYALFTLEQLKKNYSNRNLKLIPAENINDLLNRRDLVDIRKQKVVLRTAKFVKRNWISAVATVLLALFFAFLFVMDMNENPESLYAVGNKLFVKNKNGKILWTKLVSISDPYCSREAKIVDIDNNDLNEIIICGEIDPRTNLIKNSAMVVCYNSGGEEVWNYIFQDTVLSDGEILNTEYTVSILDTVIFQGQKSLLLYASNLSSFSSAIFCLDLKTGERLPGTFWASGHIMEGTVKDIDNDGKKDIVGVGYENGYEDLVFFAYELDTLIKVRPTTEQYLIRNYPVSKMKSYIRFPKTDFDNYFRKRTPGYSMNSFSKDDNHLKFRFGSSIPNSSDQPAVGYEINYDLKNINVVIGSTFRVQRDTLVAHHKLEPPYTDTEEYKNIIKSKILYWKNGNWVKRNELD
jgi:hypothetical protein